MTREEAILAMVKDGKDCQSLVDGNIYYYLDGDFRKSKDGTFDEIELICRFPGGKYEILKQKVKKEIDVFISDLWEKHLDGGTFICSNASRGYYIPAKLIVEVAE